MRDERYGPILIVRIECGGAASGPLPPPLPDPRREENRPLPAYTDPSMRYVAIYDTGPWTRSSASFLSRKAPANELSSPLPSRRRTNFIVFTDLYFRDSFFSRFFPPIVVFRPSFRFRFRLRAEKNEKRLRVPIRRCSSIDQWIPTLPSL